MVRVESDSHKSQAREAVIARWPKCCTDSNPVKNIKVSIVDITQALSSLDAEKVVFTGNPNNNRASAANQLFQLGLPLTNNEDDEEVLHQNDTERSNAKTIKDVVNEIKSLVEKESMINGSLGLVIINFDKRGVSLAKAPTQKRRRNVLQSQGKGLFKFSVLKDRNLKFDSISIVGSEFQKIPRSEFRYKELVDGKCIVYTWLTNSAQKDIEIRFEDVEKFHDLVKGHSAESCIEIPLEVCKIIPRNIEDLEPFENFLNLDRKIPERWKEYMSRDGRNRQKFIRFIAQHLLSPDSPCRFAVHPTGSVLVDGHFFTRDNIKQLGLPMPGNEQDIEFTPIMLSYREGKRHIQFEHKLKNHLGETDFSAFFYIKQLEASPFKIVSTDTDFIYNSLMFLNQFPEMERPEILLFRTKSIGGGKRKKGQPEPEPRKTVQEWIFINKLYSLIETDKKLSALKQLAVPNVVAAMTMAGNDYIDPYFFVPHVHFLNALVDMLNVWKTSIIVIHPTTKRYHANHSSFIMFLAFAFATKWKLAQDEPQQLLDLGYNKIVAQVNEKTKKDPKKQFPIAEDLRFAHKQFLFCLELYSDLGNEKLSELNLFNYGYDTNDGSNTITYENIVRVIKL